MHQNKYTHNTIPISQIFNQFVTYCVYIYIIVIAANKSRKLSKTQIVRRICDSQTTMLCWAYSAEVDKCDSSIFSLSRRI